MAKLTQCKTCNHQVSSNAQQCPSCGEKLRMGTLGKVILWVIATPFILFAIPPFVEGLTAGTTGSGVESSERHDQDQIAIRGARVLKGRMRDPDSFKLVGAWVNTSGGACLEYRARNGFGGMNKGSAVATIGGAYVVADTDEAGDFVGEWKRQCTKDMREVTSMVDSSL
jgi:hypothetical protein